MEEPRLVALNSDSETREQMAQWKDYVFPWGSKGPWAKAYRVFPKADGPWCIQHQYGGACCQQACFVGEMSRIDEPLATMLDELLTEDAPERFLVNNWLINDGLPEVNKYRTISQGLVELEDGTFIITEGTD